MVDKQTEQLKHELSPLLAQKAQFDQELSDLKQQACRHKELKELEKKIEESDTEAGQLRTRNRELNGKISGTCDPGNLALLTKDQETIQMRHDEVMTKVMQLKRDHLILVESLKDQPSATANAERVKTLTTLAPGLTNKITALETKLAFVEENIIKAARVVATTITHTYLRTLVGQQFDVVIVDEASMVPLCHLYWAASKANAAVTVVGDFNQLSPITRANTEVPWFKHIFDHLAIDSPQSALESELVTLLNIQYRMAPLIASISNALFYDNQIYNDKSTEELRLVDSLKGDKAVVMIDSTTLQPISYKPDGQGRRNFLHALMAAGLARKLSAEFPGRNHRGGYAL